MNNIEAMKLAVRALKANADPTKTVTERIALETLAIGRLQLAISEAEQEPVAWYTALEKEILKLKHNVVGNHDYTQGRWDLLGEVQDVIRKCTTPPKAEQEPVAWMYDGGFATSDPSGWATDSKVFPLYTAPPQREWVSLCNYEIAAALACSAGDIAKIADARAVEAKLKEKNT